MSRHFIVVLLILHFMSARVSLTQAQAGSTGCNLLNSTALDIMYYRMIFGFETFFAGDTIHLVADAPTSFGTPTQISLQVGNSIVATASFPGSISFTFPTTGGYYLIWKTDAPNATWKVSCNYSPLTTSDRSDPSYLVEVPPCPVFFDGRINNCDTAAPVAVYPVDVNHEAGLQIYDVFTGQILLLVSPQQLNNAPENPDGNLLIAEANNVTLYRIAGSDRGQWQVNAPQYNGKTYVLIFTELFPNAGYISREEE